MKSTILIPNSKLSFTKQNYYQTEVDMATWAWLYSRFDASNNSPVTIDGYTVYWILDVRESTSQPSDDLTAFAPSFGGDQKGWVQCRGDVDKEWKCIDDVFMSHLHLQDYKYNGNGQIPRNPRIETFHVFNMLSPDHTIHCVVKIDMDNYTINELAELLLSRFKHGIDIGIKSGAGEADGDPRLFRAISSISYSNFSTSEDIITALSSGFISNNFTTRRLFAVNSNSGAVLRQEHLIPSNQKLPLTDSSKLLKDYGLDPRFPIVATWQLDPAPKWNFDWADWSLETFMDLVTDVVDAAI